MQGVRRGNGNDRDAPKKKKKVIDTRGETVSPRPGSLGTLLGKLGEIEKA